MSSSLSERHKQCIKEVEKLTKKLDDFLNEENNLSEDNDRIIKLEHVTNIVQMLNAVLDFKIHSQQKRPNEKTDLSHYLTRSAKEYPVSKIVTCTITYIKNFEEQLLYVSDNSNFNRPAIEKLCEMYNLPKYTGIPEFGDVFGVEINHKITRAMLNTKSCIKKSKSLFLKLIDFGEDIEIEKDTSFYELPLNLKKIIPLAMLCKIVGIMSQDHYLYRKEIAAQMAVNRKCTFYIMNTTVDHLEVKVVPYNMPNDNKNSNNNDNTNSNNDNENSNNEKENSNNDNDNNYLDEISEEAVPLSSLSSVIDEYDKESMNLSSQELEEFYENNICTTNAVKAVLGFQPNDDKRICKFYNPKTGGCFKGASCRLDHVARPINAITSDVITAITGPDISAQIFFEANTIINITVTFIWNVESFYAQINNDKETKEIFVWDEYQIPPFKLLKNPPLIFDLVLARYHDNRWYRAKVISFHKNSMYEVFFVDYGNRAIVPLKHIARCFASCSQQPFQAHLFKFNNLKGNGSIHQRIEGINKLRELINNSYDVRIVSQNEDTCVEFLNGQVNQLLKYLLYNKIYKLSVY